MRDIMQQLRERVLASGNIHQVHVDTRISYPTLYRFARYDKSIDPDTIQRLVDYFGLRLRLVPGKNVHRSSR